MGKDEQARSNQGGANLEEQSQQWMQTYIYAENKHEAEKAFGALFRRWEKELLNYLQWQLWSKNQQKYRHKDDAWPEADSILLDVFQNLMEQRYATEPSFDPTKSFRGYIFTIAQRRLIDHLRRQKKTEEVDNWDLVKASGYQPAMSTASRPDEELTRQEFYHDLREFCLTLDERERIYLFLAKSGLGHLTDEGVGAVLEGLWDSFSPELQQKIRQEIGAQTEVKNIEIAQLFGVVPAVVARIARRIEEKFAAFLQERRKAMISH